MALKHCVFFAFRDDVPAAERAGVYSDLCAMQDKVDGLDHVTYGPNASFEGMARGYTDGFIMTFRDVAAHHIYHDHPDHKKAGQRLVNAVVDGLDGILVFDFDDQTI